MCKCRVSWCNEETEFYNKSQKYVFCPTHMQYKQYGKNANTRPWLMYKVEKIVEGDFKCECCGFEPFQAYPHETFKVLSSLMDVDHINPKIKGTDKGENPSNYQLLCKHCHVLKSHREGDFTNKKSK